MSKYIILGIPKGEYEDKNVVALTFFHTITKYQNNEPYFSAIFNENVINKYSIKKENIPAILKLAQGKSYGCLRKNTKYKKIIVLKLNSTKLKKLLEREKQKR